MNMYYVYVNINIYIDAYYVGVDISILSLL